MKSFYHILVNNLLGLITNQTVWFGVVFFAYLQTRSVFTTSLITGLYLAATAASGFFFGSIVDHHKKKYSMLVSSGISLFAYLCAFVIFFTSPKDTFTHITSPILWIFISTILIGVIVGNIRGIAIPTLVTLLCPKDKRDKANGLVGTVSGIGYMTTSAISGFLIAQTSMYGVLLVGIIGSVIVFLHLFFLDIPEKKIVHLEHAPKIDIKGTIRVIRNIPGLMALIFFAMFNNFLGGVFGALIDAYGLSLVSVETWGLLWAGLGTAFILGGLSIAKWGLGKQPLRSLMMANAIIWITCTLFTIYPSIILLAVGAFIYLLAVPYIEASEQTIFQNLVPQERQGRVFGFAQTVEQIASPLTAFMIGPIAEFIVIPFMTNGLGAQTIGMWFGTGINRGIAVIFTIAGILGFALTYFSWKSPFYRRLEEHYHSVV